MLRYASVYMRDVALMAYIAVSVRVNDRRSVVVFVTIPILTFNTQIILMSLAYRALDYHSCRLHISGNSLCSITKKRTNANLFNNKIL